MNMESNVQSVSNYFIAKMYVKKIEYDKTSYYVQSVSNYQYIQC
jgi:hypothetical protein